MSAEPIIQPVHIDRAALLALHAAQSRRYPALLESAAVGKELGRHDILFAFPGDRLTLDAAGTRGAGYHASATSFLKVLDEWWVRERQPPRNLTLPFHGGWLLYLSYELASSIEPTLQLPKAAGGPVAQAVRMPAAVVFEHRSSSAWIVVESSHGHLLKQIEADLTNAVASCPADDSLLAGRVEEEAPQKYLVSVERALEYIAAGDIYQANLSRSWRAELASKSRPYELYQRLRQTNPAPFAAIALFDDLCVISSSPERLIEVRGGWVATRPIAGTRPRGRDQDTDTDLARELHAHPKERAEHVMLIDLERNDLGRICEAGTVEVNEYMTLESYAHVHHIVSNIRGRLRENITPGQTIAAVFPGGTITGCPKVRCMQIIGELEGQARGPYTGSLGYLNLDGTMDLNILIRSLELRGNVLTLRAGAGIVADSIPERELEETRAKARGVLRALS